MDSLPNEWPEPIISVQSIAESGTIIIPDCYIKPLPDRPLIAANFTSLTIPIIDLNNLSVDLAKCSVAMSAVSDACRDWGFFQVVNHGINIKLIQTMITIWRNFFCLPMEEKAKFTNSPRTYEGYGSRLGVEKAAILDWGDYFFLNLFPSSVRNYDKWPELPTNCREVTEEYGKRVAELCRKLMKILSMSLGLDVGFLEEKFGGEEVGASLRVNYYPKCPQPDLTMGLSAHSDPGGLTVLLVDEHVPGLQVRKGDDWITIRPTAGALIVNIGDQIQVLSNAIYKSVEHRVVANTMAERMSIAFFYNPKNDLILEPASQLVTLERPQLYQPMTYNEYRLYVRKKGLRGKTQVESLKAM